MVTTKPSSPAKAVQLAWKFGSPSTHSAQNLSLLLEERARELRGSEAFFLRYPDSKEDEPVFLTLAFRDLVIEQNAWVNYLRNRGVKKGEPVVVWLPFGLSFLSVSYALFKIGAHAVILDPDFEWKSGCAMLQELGPKHMVGTRQTLAYAKSLVNGLRGLTSRVEVDGSLQRFGSALRSYRATPTYWEEDQVMVTFLKARGSSRSKATFEQRELCDLASQYKEWFHLQDGDRALAGSPLEALLLPAGGIANLVVSERFSDNSPRRANWTIQAARELGLNAISGEARFWQALRSATELPSTGCQWSFEAILTGYHIGGGDLDTLTDVFPEARFNVVFGAGASPFLTRRALESFRERDSESDSLRGIYVGEPLSGVRLSLAAFEGLRWMEDPMAASGLGEMAVAKDVSASIGDEDSWALSGAVGFYDRKGGLWYCGLKEEIVSSSFGGFCPVRCEAVFNKHPRVKRSALLSLTRNGKTRPGIVIETSLADLPKKGVEESRFKAELLRLGAEFEETSLIVDIFFSDRLPLEEGSFAAVDRKRLSQDYSRRLRF